jgi:excisionase family DNA binding protein
MGGGDNLAERPKFDQGHPRFEPTAAEPLRAQSLAAGGPTRMPEKYLTATQVAEMLQLNVETVYDMVKDGTLSATKVRGRWRFDLSELRHWFKTHRSTTATK